MGLTGGKERVGAMAAPPPPSTEGWPLEKLRRNLAAAPPGRKRCVLLTTGAMNPVHLAHVDMFERAKRDLQQHHGMEVLAGWLSPSHEDYVGPKMQRKRAEGDTSALYLTTEVRHACVEAATRDSPWLDVGRWEGQQPAPWKDYPVVCAALHEHLAAEGLGDVEMMYLCGLDHFRYCSRGIRTHRGTFRVCVVPRDGDQPPQPDPTVGLVVSAASTDTLASLSSTAVRRRLVAGEPVTGLVDPRVEQILGQLVAVD